jgi:hypothetical protein
MMKKGINFYIILIYRTLSNLNFNLNNILSMSKNNSSTNNINDQKGMENSVSVTNLLLGKHKNNNNNQDNNDDDYFDDEKTDADVKIYIFNKLFIYFSWILIDTTMLKRKII